MNIKRISQRSMAGMAVVCAILLPLQAQAQQVPAAGASARIDAIKKAGAIRVGVMANSPWLIENTKGDGETWQGPAWLLATEYAKRLGVKITPVLVSHETKIPVLASNQVDIMISPLAETPERLKIVDFVMYSNTSTCLFGRADNPKLANVKTVDDLNRPDITIAYFTGGAYENWVKKRFPNAILRGVSTSGSPAPIEEIMARRSDVTPINHSPWVALGRKVKGLKVFPAADNCQGSQELAAPVGLAIDLHQAVFLDWLRKVEASIHRQLEKEELRMNAVMR